MTKSNFSAVSQNELMSTIYVEYICSDDHVNEKPWFCHEAQSKQMYDEDGIPAHAIALVTRMRSRWQSERESFIPDVRSINVSDQTVLSFTDAILLISSELYKFSVRGFEIGSFCMICLNNARDSYVNPF